MKQLSTTPVSTSFTTRACVVAVTILMLVATPIQWAPTAKADQYDDQIAAIQSQIDQYNQQASKLSKQADTLQNQLNKLSDQKAVIQKQLDQSQIQYDQLRAKIKQTEKDIAANKEALGEALANMYVDGDVSPIVMIAGSDNISDTLNGLEYIDSMREELTGKIQEIKDLKAKLETQKTQVERVLGNQKRQRDALTKKEAERAQLISATRGQESAYRQLTQKSKAEISKVRAAQQAALAARMANSGNSGSIVPGDPNHGGYPADLANAPQDSMSDPWGLFNRECVSYVAWKVYQKNHSMPYGYGNANMWPGNAARDGYRVSYSAPKPNTGGFAGVISAGDWGHIVWVDHVNADGTLNISQYNWGFAGQYSEMYNVTPSTYDTYIYF